MGAYSDALQSFWLDVATVSTQQQTTNATTGLSDLAWVESLTGIPCKLSFSTLAAATGDGVATVSQTVKLFCSPALTIVPGSRVTVTRPSGVVLAYKASGLPAIYSAHQEVTLEPLEVYA